MKYLFQILSMLPPGHNNHQISYLIPSPTQSWAKSKPVIVPDTVFVGGLGVQVGEEQLEKVFSVFGQVKKVLVVMDIDGLSKGFGFITFHDCNVLRKVEQAEVVAGGCLLSTAQAVQMVHVPQHQGGGDGHVVGVGVQPLQQHHPVWYPSYLLYLHHHPVYYYQPFAHTLHHHLHGQHHPHHPSQPSQLSFQ